MQIFPNLVTYVGSYIIKQCYSYHTKIAKQHKMKLTAVFAWRLVATTSLKIPTPSSAVFSWWTSTIVIDTKTTESSASQKCKQTDIDSLLPLYMYSRPQYVQTAFRLYICIVDHNMYIAIQQGRRKLLDLGGANLGKGEHSYTIETLMPAFLLRYLANAS